MKALKKFSSSIFALFLLSALFLPHFYCDPFYLSSQTAPEAGSELKIYATENSDDLQKLICKAIKRAKHSISITSFSFSDYKVINALNKKAKEGVKVEVYFDSEAAPELASKLHSNIRSYPRHNSAHMHLKILVVDESLLYLGSANMTYDSLKHYDNLIAGLHSPDFCKFVLKYLKNIQEVKKAAPGAYFEGHVASQNCSLQFLPQPPEAEERVLKMLRSAKKTIRVAQFAWTRKDFAQELCNARKRGVDVRVCMERTTALGFGYPIMEILTQAKIPVYTNRDDSLMHHKFCVIDDKILISGSANWTMAAFLHNDDCYMTLEPLNPEQQKRMRCLWTAFEKSFLLRKEENLYP